MLTLDQYNQQYLMLGMQHASLIKQTVIPFFYYDPYSAKPFGGGVGALKEVPAINNLNGKTLVWASSFITKYGFSNPRGSIALSWLNNNVKKAFSLSDPASVFNPSNIFQIRDAMGYTQNVPNDDYFFQEINLCINDVRDILITAATYDAQTIQYAAKSKLITDQIDNLKIQAMGFLLQAMKDGVIPPPANMQNYAITSGHYSDAQYTGELWNDFDFYVRAGNFGSVTDIVMPGLTIPVLAPTSYPVPVLPPTPIPPEPLPTSDPASVLVETLPPPPLPPIEITTVPATAETLTAYAAPEPPPPPPPPESLPFNDELSYFYHDPDVTALRLLTTKNGVGQSFLVGPGGKTIDSVDVDIIKADAEGKPIMQTNLVLNIYASSSRKELSTPVGAPLEKSQAVDTRFLPSVHGKRVRFKLLNPLSLNANTKYFFTIQMAGNDLHPNSYVQLRHTRPGVYLCADVVSNDGGITWATMYADMQQKDNGLNNWAVNEASGDHPLTNLINNPPQMSVVVIPAGDINHPEILIPPLMPPPPPVPEPAPVPVRPPSVSQYFFEGKPALWAKWSARQIMRGQSFTNGDTTYHLTSIGVGLGGLATGSLSNQPLQPSVQILIYSGPTKSNSLPTNVQPIAISDPIRADYLAGGTNKVWFNFPQPPRLDPRSKYFWVVALSTDLSYKDSAGDYQYYGNLALLVSSQSIDGETTVVSRDGGITWAGSSLGYCSWETKGYAIDEEQISAEILNQVVGEYSAQTVELNAPIFSVPLSEAIAPIHTAEPL